jgi:cytochrome c-type biogenesis protein CcmH
MIRGHLAWLRVTALPALGMALALLTAPASTLGAQQAAAGAGAPQASLTDIEAEVMCPICGTLLELSESPQGQRERVFIKGLIAEGKTKGEIKDALVAQYGSGVLALPKGSGFNLSAYLVPIVAFIAAAIALALGIRRWRRAASRRDSEKTTATEPDDEDSKRLDADLARYDL